MEGGGRGRMHPDKVDSQWVFCATPSEQALLNVLEQLGFLYIWLISTDHSVLSKY